jgi:hypothetical protein
VEGIHGLPAVAASTLLPVSSRKKDTWWETRSEESLSMKTPRDEQSEDESGETEYVWDSSDEQEEGDTKKTAYMLWDSMDEEDRTDTIDSLKQFDKWVTWTTNFSTSRKTPKMNVGDSRLKGGGEQETFGSKSQKRFVRYLRN